MGDGIRIATLALLLTLFVSALGCSDDPARGPGKLATRCEKNEDCESLICAGLEGEAKLCSVGCTDPLGDECDEGFRCRRPEDLDQLACVCTDPQGCEVGEPSAQCDSESDCDDRIDCTEDRCDGTRCLHRLTPEVCADGESCRLSEGGCTLGEPCAQDAECQAHADECTGFSLCDATTSRCRYGVVDHDGDRYAPASCGGEDCDDDSAMRAPGNTELCDSIDNDCDRVIDEDASSSCASGVCSSGECGGCDPSLIDCSRFQDATLCVDLNSDASNCGGCGQVCESGLSCFDGVCSERDGCESGVSCPLNSSCVNVPGGIECRCNAGFEPNGGATACVDIDECARGFDDCGASAFCLNTNGSFQCTCSAGFRLLGVECIDVNECAEGFDCGTGTCINLTGTVDCSCDFGSAIDPASGICHIVDACQAGTLPGHAWCDGACRDTQIDSSYCGSCFGSCVGEGMCSGGQCVCADPQLTYCSGTCVNTQTSVTHCGWCDNSCPSGASCVVGACDCPGDQVECGATCAAIHTTDRCLSCDDACPIGASCTDTGCQCPGDLPNVCDGQCVNVLSDNEHCGGCGGFCDVGVGMACSNGECKCPPNLPDQCGSACKNFQNDKDHCGNCDTQCSGMCVNGECNNGG